MDKNTFPEVTTSQLGSTYRLLDLKDLIYKQPGDTDILQSRTEYGSDDDYAYGVYFPQYEAEQDFLWLNWHGDMDSMKAGNESWAETGQSIQAGFNETATCTGPDIYNSAEIYSTQAS